MSDSVAWETAAERRSVAMERRMPVSVGKVERP